jgi:hypothetical protein
MKKIALTIIAIATTILSCNSNEENYIVSFEHDIHLIFLTKCLYCHSETAKEANLDLSTYESLMDSSSHNGPVIRAYDAYNSFLYEKVSKPNPIYGNRMPLGEEPLSFSEIKLIEDWINQGAKNN